MQLKEWAMDAGEKLRIRKFYDALGGMLYDERYMLEQTVKYDVILRHVAPLMDDLVLDDGCGTGLLLERLQSHGVGVDLSHNLLSTAHAKLEEGLRTNLVQADADHLPFRYHVFDKVFAVTLIQNMPEPEHALREIRRVARVGSEVVVTALKKSFTIRGFRQLLATSGLTLKSLVKGEELKEWIAFVTR